MTAISQGLKAGLAAGVIYAAIIGLMSLTTFLGCSSAQIAYIAAQHPSNVSASEIFYGTDIIYYPMVYAVLTLIFGLIFGLIFALVYSKLPGSTSKFKGSVLGVAVFLAVAFIGPGFFEEYACGGSAFPYLILGLSVPAAILFGYLLGSFYDSFGRLEREETEQRAIQEHWSDALRRKPAKEEDEEEKPG
jgi:hypothetical protein